MKIAVDSGPLTSGHKIRGVGMYTGELLKALGPSVEAVNFAKANLSKYDIIHYTSFDPFFKSFKLIPGVKTIVTIHDLTPLIYPNHYPPGLKGKIRFLAQRLMINRVAAIITDTENSKKDISRLMGVNPDKIHVVYLAPKEIFRKISDQNALKKVKEKYHLPDKFVLYVGDVNYNKNVANLIEACKIAGLTLVVCGRQALDIEDLGNDLRSLKGPRDWIRYLFGKPHPQLAHYKDLLKAIEENKSVMRLGFVSDADLAAIYNLATLYCQPSLYEGFGLPVLEAIASDCSVVCSKTQALSEIAGNAAVYVDPYVPAKIAEGFKNLVKNPKFPREYSWAKTAAQTMEVYQKVS
jgi:glycosyltransferase involved in cell wall biosynthesis